MRKDFVVVGSQAMKFHYPDFPRIPKDTDIVCSRATFLQVIKDDSDIEWKTVDAKAVHMADSVVVKYTTLPSTFEYIFSDGSKSLELILDSLCDETSYAPVQVLYSLKKAHIHFPIKFDKHIGDLMFLRQKLREKRGISLEQDLGSFDDLLDGFPALTYLHFQDTERLRGKLRTPKMAQDTKKFFGKSNKFVTSYYVHDNMHKAIAEMLHNQSPVYLKILKEGAEVETDPQLWSSLTVQEKIWCVLEEVYVIALERKILPQMFGLKHLPTLAQNEKSKADYRLFSDKETFDWALFRACTTLCDGFFRDFAVRAYDEINKQYDPQYVEKFFTNIHKYEQNVEE